MCQSLLLGTAKLILNVFNVVHFLVGAGLTGFGLYLELKYPSTFSEMTIGIGGFVLLTAMLGLFAVKKQNYCMLTSYSVFMALLFLANLIILIIAYVNFDTLMGKVDSQSSKVSKAKDWIRSHEQIYKYIQLGLVAVEFVCFGLGLFYRRSEPLKRNMERLNDEVNGEVSLQPNYDTLDETPLTESQKKRAAMKEKYGFKRKTSEGTTRY